MWNIPALNPMTNAPNNTVHGYARISRPSNVTAQIAYAAQFSVPDGVYRLLVTAIGGGASTGGGTGSGTMGRCVLRYPISVVPGQVIPITLGTAEAYPTTAAGTTSVGTYLTLSGGDSGADASALDAYSPINASVYPTLTPSILLNSGSGSGGATATNGGGTVIMEW